MEVDFDIPEQDSTSLNYIQTHGMLVPENKFIPESIFDSNEFGPCIKDIMNLVFSTETKFFLLLKVEYLKSNGGKRKALYTFIEENFPLFTGFSSEGKRYLIIVKKDKENELKEKINRLEKAIEFLFERMELAEIESYRETEQMKEEIEREEEEKKRRNEKIRMPCITVCTVYSVTNTSAFVSFNKVDKRSIMEKNKGIVGFRLKYKDEEVKYYMFLYVKGEFITIDEYKEDKGKIVFELKNLKSNSLIMFKISVKFERFYSIPEKSFYFYTHCKESDCASFFAFGNNENNCMILTKENTSAEILKENEIDEYYEEYTIENQKEYNIKAFLSLKGNIISFSFFDTQTLIVLQNGIVINSGKVKYSHTSDNVDFDIEEYDKVTDAFSQPYQISYFNKNTIFIRKVSVGRDHCIALSDAGNCYSWGGNLQGQLGLGLDKDKVVGLPHKINIECEGNNIFIYDITSGLNSTMALGIYKSKTLLFFWGEGQGSETSKLSLLPCTSLPIVLKFPMSENIKSIYSKFYIQCVICKDDIRGINQLFLFGLNLHYQLGFYNNQTEKQKNWDLPTQVPVFDRNEVNVLDVKVSKCYSVVIGENKEGKRKVYFTGKLPFKKEVIKEFEEYKMEFEDDVVGVGAGYEDVFFMMKNGIVKYIDSKGKIGEIGMKTVNLERYDYSDVGMVKMEAMKGNCIISLKCKNMQE